MVQATIYRLQKYFNTHIQNIDFLFVELKKLINMEDKRLKSDASFFFFFGLRKAMLRYKQLLCFIKIFLKLL